MRWGGVLAIGLAAGLSACAAVPVVQPSVSEITPRIEGLDADGIDVVFDVSVSNPYLATLHVPRFRWHVEVQDRMLASGRQGLRQEVPAVGVGTVPIPVRFRYRELAGVYGSLEGRSEAEYLLTGQFSIPALGSAVDVPFEHRGTLPIVRAPQVRIEGLDTSELTAIGGNVHVDARISNPNGFPLDLGSVGYVLGVGDEEVAFLRSAVAPLAPGGSATVRLTGSVSLLDAIGGLVEGDLADTHVSARGAVTTPYGELLLP
jgi:LEA14-like dessication related protein